jgi:hypothetical protein
MHGVCRTFVIKHVLISHFYLYSQTVEIEQERKRAVMAAEVEARIDAGKVEAVQAYKVSHLSCNIHGIQAWFNPPSHRRSRSFL